MMKKLIIICAASLVVALAFWCPAVASANSLTGPGASAWLNISDLGPGQPWPIVLPNIDSSGLTKADNWPTWHWLIHGTDPGTGVWHAILMQNFHVGPGTNDELWMRTVELPSQPTGDWALDAKSSHVIQTGLPAANPYDLRFDLYQATAGGTWDVTPYYRLSGGSWQAFNTGDYTGTGWPGGGPWTSTAFDFGTGVGVVIDSSTDGTLTFGDPYIIPEPGTICLLGLGGLALLRRKRGYGA